MLGLAAFIRSVGSPLKAETLLMRHFSERRRMRFGWDKRYAEMEFGLHWDPIFHRHFHETLSPRVPGSPGKAGTP